jgi:hypothetical protein
MNITGKFISASPVFAVGANGTQKRTFQLDITGNSQYLNILEFSLMGQNLPLADSLNYGKEIEVSFNINGRKWKNEAKGIDQIFMDLQCYGIVEIKREKVQATPGGGVIIPPAAAAVAPVAPVAGAEEEQLPEWLKES